MPIQFRCTRCLDEISVPDGTSGKKTRCPHCQEVQEIPTPQTSASSAPGPPRSDSPYESAASQEADFRESFSANPANPFASPSAAAQVPNSFSGQMPETVRAAMRQKLLIPAIIQTVLVGLSLLSSLGFAVVALVMVLEPSDRNSGLIMLAIQLVWSLVHALSLTGLASAIRFKSIGWAWAGFVIPILSFPLGNCCCLLYVIPLSVSIWGMVCLSDPKVRSLFP
ncbi:MAG: hypothetical protein WD045_07180 [Pirellulaceae bacterium]